MENGIAFLKSQVGTAVAQHELLLRSLRDNEATAQDERYRDLCARHLPHMHEHQRMLEEYQAKLGGASSASDSPAVIRELADAPRQSDFNRLIQDLLLSRQSEDTFKTFRDAGRTLGLTELARIGEVAERHHDAYAQDANRLVQQMFVEHARGAERMMPSMVDRPNAP